MKKIILITGLLLANFLQCAEQKTLAEKIIKEPQPIQDIILSNVYNKNEKTIIPDFFLPAISYQIPMKHISLIAISPDSKYLVTGSYMGTANVWDLNKENFLNPIASFEHMLMEAVAISADNKFVVTG